MPTEKSFSMHGTIFGKSVGTRIAFPNGTLEIDCSFQIYKLVKNLMNQMRVGMKLIDSVLDEM